MSKTKKGKTLIRRLVLVIAAVILGVNVYKWNAGNLLGNRMPMPFGFGMATVLSGSMEPTLSIDDLVIVQETEEYQIGDILVYQSGNVLVIHRLIAVEGEQLIFKGDANNVVDDPVLPDAVKGKMVYSISYVGILVRLLRQPWCVAGILILVVLMTELSFRRQKDNDKNELKKLEDEIRKLKEDLSDK